MLYTLCLYRLVVLMYMYTNCTPSGMDLNRGVEVFSVSEIVSELQYIVEEELEPYAEYTVSVIAQTGGGVSDAVTASFTTPEGG